MTIKVSVVVPVYNPGSAIDDCIRTLLDQSLPSDEYEVVFVDDGSTDETPARLDALAAEHDNVRVKHIPNSGWPGRPRNLGTDMARGEFVYYVDNDDWIGHEALERLYATAVEQDADIVIGKVVGQGKYVPRALFRETRHDVRIGKSSMLLGLLSPHKLFRKSMLVEHDIRFPEGRRRLEDHVFVMHAYFHALTISVVADYPFYHWVLRGPRATAENASAAEFDPVQYYGNLREVLDVVEAHTEPGELRQTLMSHWYRGKMLKRVGSGNLLRRDPELRAQIVAEVRKLADERFGPWAEDLLGFNRRLRSRLLREGTLDGLLALAAVEQSLKAETTLVSSHAVDGNLVVSTEGILVSDDGPLAFERSGDRVVYAAPGQARAELSDEVLDITDDLPKSRLQMLPRAKRDGAEFLQPDKTSFRLEERPRRRWHGEGDAAGDTDAVVEPDDATVLTLVTFADAELDPATMAGGSPLPPGDYQLNAVVTVAGFQEVGRVRRPDGSRVTLTVTDDGRLVEKVRAAAPQPRDAEPATPQAPQAPSLTRRLKRKLSRVVRQGDS